MENVADSEGASLPKEVVLLHNHVRSFDLDDNGTKAFRSDGESGFRTWRAPLPEGWELCDCGWRPFLGPHYAEWKEKGYQVNYASYLD